MQGYNNNRFNGGYVGGAQFNAYPANSGFPNYAPTLPNYGVSQQPQPMTTTPDGLVYVHGLDGANAYQLPPNVTRMILWDDTDDTFYIKGYDNMGKPRILAHKDFFDHIDEPIEKKEFQPNQIDMSNYVTKDDIANLMTKEDFRRMIRKLSVGERGRIVVNNEHDA